MVGDAGTGMGGLGHRFGDGEFGGVGPHFWDEMVVSPLMVGVLGMKWLIKKFDLFPSPTIFFNSLQLPLHLPPRSNHTASYSSSIFHPGDLSDHIMNGNEGGLLEVVRWLISLRN
ncbi:hypothetical protein QVD17_11919 [Tagetes erecta]|uniref:Uncharacterized protein n=1 Tax=Tagetes erecta TaxID=13708 RepID=A0AAD8L0H5_TARER|nr:hypothetical protein QVD17_11919 [Tagetes erecta]